MFHTLKAIWAKILKGEGFCTLDMMENPTEMNGLPFDSLMYTYVSIIQKTFKAEFNMRMVYRNEYSYSNTILQSNV